MRRARIGLVLLLLVVLCAPVAPARALWPNLLDGMVNYWPLDEVSGVRYDAHGSLDLTDNNTVGYAAGVVGNAASFVMTNTEYLSANSPINLFPLTVNFWIKFNSRYLNERIMGSLSSGPTSGWGIRVHASDLGKLYGAHYSSSGGSTVSADSAAGWRMVTFIVQDTRTYLCIDTMCASGSVAALSESNSIINFMMGTYSAVTTLFDGTIDEVGIWNRALSTTEIAALYNDGAGVSYDEMPWLYVPDIEDGTLSEATDSAQALLNALAGLLLYAIGLAVGLAIVIVIMRLFRWM